jgi:hypothetical protein
MRPAAVALAVILALGTAACGDDGDTVASGGTTGEPPSDAPAACTDGTWQVFDYDGLSFSLPEDMVDQEAVGIDSLVGAYEGDGLVVNFDFGWYSSDFSELDEFDPTRSAVVVDGHDATLVTADVGTTGGFGGRFVTALTTTVDDGEPDGAATRLALWAAYDDPGRAATAECITTTVRFTS